MCLVSLLISNWTQWDSSLPLWLAIIEQSDLEHKSSVEPLILISIRNARSIKVYIWPSSFKLVSCDLFSGNAKVTLLGNAKVTLLKPKLTCFTFMTIKHETPSNKIDLGNEINILIQFSSLRWIIAGPFSFKVVEVLKAADECKIHSSCPLWGGPSPCQTPPMKCSQRNYRINSHTAPHN